MIDQPLTLPCGATLANRIAKAAMTERLATGHFAPNETHERLYRRWGKGGAGMLLTGNVVVDRAHPEAAGNVALDRDTDMDALRRFAAAGTEGGAHLWMQLSHAGRQTPGPINPAPDAPSAVPMVLKHGDFGEPVAMSEQDITGVIDAFGFAAGQAKEAGFTGVQIHGAHGYLLSQFLNPLANHRRDKWGGGLTNRARLLLAVVGAVRAAVGPRFPVSVKLNSSDFQGGGFTLEECARVAKWLEDASVDLLEVSGGNYESPAMIMGKRGTQPKVKKSTRRREAFFVDYAAYLREHTRVPLMVTGGFRTHAAMAEAIASGAADVIGLGRTLIPQPELPRAILLADANALDVESTIQPRYALMPWYYCQLRRLGRGEDPDLTLTGEDALTFFQAEEAASLAALKS